MDATRGGLTAAARRAAQPRRNDVGIRLVGTHVAGRVAERLDRIIADAVSKRIDVVVVGEEPGQKPHAAHRPGIRRVDERRFRRPVGTAAG